MIDGNFLQTALTVLTLSSLAGVGLSRSRIKELNDRLDESDKELARKDRRLTDAESEIVHLKAKVNSQSHDLEATGRLVRGESYWSELGDKLDVHHTAAVAHWSEDERLLRQILRDLDTFTNGREST